MDMHMTALQVMVGVKLRWMMDVFSLMWNSIIRCFQKGNRFGGFGYHEFYRALALHDSYIPLFVYKPSFVLFTTAKKPVKMSQADIGSGKDIKVVKEIRIFLKFSLCNRLIPYKDKRSPCMIWDVQATSRTDGSLYPRWVRQSRYAN